MTNSNNIRIAGIGAALLLLNLMFTYVLSNSLISSSMMEVSEKMDRFAPIVIVDFVALAETYPVGASQDELNTLMLKTSQSVSKLAKEGYVVIDRSNIVRAPEKLNFPTELLIQ